MSPPHLDRGQPFAGAGMETPIEDAPTLLPFPLFCKAEPPLIKPDRRPQREEDPGVERFNSALAIFFRQLREELRGGQ